jgi:hypothetical protein
MERAWSNADQLFPAFIRIAQQGIPFVWLPYGRTDKVREQAALQLLDSDFTHIVMLDSDQRHPQDIVKRLCSHAARDPEKRIIGGLYFRRGEPYDPLAWRIGGEDGLLYSLETWQDELLEVDIIGTGALMIHRSVFEELPRPWFFYDYSQVLDPQYAWPTEDISFSLLARQHGIKIYCDTTVDSPHLTTNWITRQTYDTFRMMQNAKEAIET